MMLNSNEILEKNLVTLQKLFLKLSGPEKLYPSKEDCVLFQKDLLQASDLVLEIQKQIEEIPVISSISIELLAKVFISENESDSLRETLKKYRSFLFRSFMQTTDILKPQKEFIIFNLYLNFVTRNLVLDIVSPEFDRKNSIKF
jgi:hypothetical protein